MVVTGSHNSNLSALDRRMSHALTSRYIGVLRIAGGSDCGRALRDGTRWKRATAESRVDLEDLVEVESSRDMPDVLTVRMSGCVVICEGTDARRGLKCCCCCSMQVSCSGGEEGKAIAASMTAEVMIVQVGGTEVLLTRRARRNRLRDISHAGRGGGCWPPLAMMMMLTLLTGALAFPTLRPSSKRYASADKRTDLHPGRPLRWRWEPCRMRRRVEAMIVDLAFV